MHERMEPCEAVDQDVQAKEMHEGGPGSISDLRVIKRC